MKKKRIISALAIMLVISFSVGTVSSAAEYKHLEKDLMKTGCTSEKFDTVESVQSEDMASPHVVTEIKPDAYEPNNSIEEAYPYSNTKKLTGNEFIEGYRNSNCHVEGDEDFFYLTLYSGTKYDVVLKNLYGCDRHIYLWKENSDGTWTRWKNEKQETGKPEHYYFTPLVTGKYYIQIAGGEPDSASFFFAVEKVGTINPALWPYEVFN